MVVMNVFIYDVESLPSVGANYCSPQRQEALQVKGKPEMDQDQVICSDGGLTSTWRRCH